MTALTHTLRLGRSPCTEAAPPLVRPTQHPQGLARLAQRRHGAAAGCPRSARWPGALRQRRQQDLGDIGHVVPSHQQVEDLFRGLRRVGSAIRHLS